MVSPFSSQPPFDKPDWNTGLAECYLDVDWAMMVVIGSDQTVQAVNRKTCEVLGYPRETIVGVNWFDAFVPAAIRDEVKRVFERVMRGELELAEYFENPVLTSSGEERLIAWRNALVHDGTGRIAGTVSSGQDITSHRTTEGALRKSEELFKSLYEGVSAGIIIQAADGHIVHANSIASEIFGMDHEDIEGRTSFDPKWQMVREDMRPLPGEEHPSMVTFRTGRPVRNAVRGLFSGDPEHMRWLLVNTQPVLDPHEGKVNEVIVTFSDITALRKAEKALRAEMEFAESLIDTAQVIILVLDTEGRIVRFNRYMEKLSGYRLDEVQGKDWFDTFLPERFCVEVRTLFQHAVHDIHTRGNVNPILTKSGDERDIEWYDITLKDSNGNVTGVLSTGQDVTERRQAEREIENLAHFPLEDPNPVMRVSDTGAVFFANPASAALFAQWPSIQDVTVSETWRASISNVLATGKPAAIEEEYGDKTFSLTFTPMKGSKFVNIYGIDITERKKLEAQFVQAQKMEAVGQLAGGVAHDFNNLLQVIDGYGTMALDDIEPKHPVRPAIEEMMNASKRAARLVAQLLAFSRRQVMRPESLDLNALIENLMKMVRRVIGEHIQVDFLRGHDLGRILADQGMIEQVVMNLCVNARDAMPEGGSLVIETGNVLLNEEYCRVHPWAEPGRFLLLSVTDSGHGMDRATLDRIFEPFFTTKELGKGTGLGLATVYGIVRQHKGMIQVYSEPGQGTRFKVYLPVSGLPHAEIQTDASGAAAGGTETILMAEDDDALRILTQMTLERAGYTLLVASDGKEAVELFRRNAERVDLLLFDVVMPRMGGRDAHKQIDALRPGIPTVFASGYSENAVHTNFVLQDGLIFVSKPCAREDLLRAIRQALDARKP